MPFPEPGPGVKPPTDSGNLKVGILGAGVFGTVLANILAANGHPVHLHTRDDDLAETMRRQKRNPRSLPGHPLHEGVTPTSSLKLALADTRLVLFAVASAGFRATARSAANWLPGRAILISTTKGIEPEGFTLMSQILGEELPGRRVGVLSGPNIAEEIADQQPTATVIASQSAEVRSLVQAVLHTDYFRVFSSKDVYGVELAGVLKNIYAIAAGYADALGVGQNSVGMLLTRSLAEMSRFACSMGANPLTFLGLAGVGDLFVTCSSPLSRNFQLGRHMGQGLELAAAQQKLGCLAEGVNTLQLVRDKARELDIYMPVASGLYELIHQKRPLTEVLGELMGSEQARDVEFVLPSAYFDRR